jgi:hypothetical protein
MRVANPPVGDSVEGNICFFVPKEQTSLVLVAAGSRYFALQ